MLANITILEGGQTLTNVHPAGTCKGEVCAIHNMTNHSMRSFPQNFRMDWGGFMERMCPHGIGHPDPDDYKVINDPSYKVHGCDGCCR